MAAAARHAPRHHGSMAAWRLLVVGIAVAAGCGRAGPPPASPAPAATKSPPAAAPAASAKRQPDQAPADPAIPELPLPAGQLVAHLRKDFRGGSNGHADSAGSGKWTYLAASHDNPSELGQRVSVMRPTVQRTQAAHYQYRLQTAGRGTVETSVSVGNEGHVVLQPSMVGPYVTVARWTSGVSGRVTIVGRWQGELDVTGAGVVARVFVDGAQEFAGPPASSAGTPSKFRIEATVVPGSTVDFTAGIDFLQPVDLRDAFAVRLEAAVVQLSPDVSGLQPDPEVGARIIQASRSSPRPLPKSADISQSFNNPQVRLAWLRRTFLPAVGNEEAGGGAAATSTAEFLDAYCRRLAGDPAAPTASAAMRLGVRAVESGSDEPLVLAALASAYLRLGDAATYPQAIDLLNRCGPALPDRYPPVVAAWLDCLHVVAARLADPHSGSRTKSQFTRQAIDHIVQAARQSELSSHDRQMLLHLINDRFLPVALEPCRHELSAALAQQPAADPWLREMLLAHQHYHLAWQARGSGTVDTVSEEAALQFSIHLTHARRHAVAAWSLRPQLPEAAALLIGISMGNGGAAGEDGRFWFDEAVAADVFCQDACQRYALYLRPRWLGSHDRMLALAREYLATERFDTELPLLYRAIVGDISSDVGGWRSTLEIPGVHDDLVRLCQGYLAAAKDEVPRRTWRTEQAAVHWLPGRQSEARDVLQALGDLADRRTFERYDLTFGEVARALRDAQTENPPFFPDDPATATRLVFAGPTQLVAATAAGTIDVWNTESRKRVKSLQEHASQIACLELTLDRELLLSADRDGKLTVWDVGSWEPLHRLELPRTIHAAAWARQGEEVLIACGGQSTSELVTWNLKSSEHQTEPWEMDHPVRQLAPLSRLNSVLLSIGGEPGTASAQQLFRWRRGGGFTPLLGHFARGVTAWRCSTDESKLYVSGLARLNPDQTTLSPLLNMFDPESFQLLAQERLLPGSVTSIAWLGDEQHLAALCDGGGVAHFANDRSVGGIRRNQPAMTSWTISSDARQLAAIDRGGRIQLWPLAENSGGWRISSPLIDTNLGAAIRELRFSPDGKQLTVSSSGGISVWDYSQGAGSSLAVAASPPAALQAAVYPSGERYAIIGRDRNGLVVTQILKIPSSLPENTIAIEGRSASYVAVSPDSRWLAIGDDLGGVMVIDTGTYVPLPWGKLTEHTAGICAMAFSADGRALVTASRDGAVKYWELPAPGSDSTETRAPVDSLTSRQTFAASQAPTAVAVDAVNKRVAASKQDTQVFEWTSGGLLYTVEGTLPVFSADGSRLVTGRLDPEAPRYATVRRADNGQEQVRLVGGHTWPLTAVTISPDGKTVMTGDEGGAVRAWNSGSGAELLELPIAGRNP